MTRRVFVIEPVNLDVTTASRYGPLTYIFGHEDKRASIWSAAFIEQSLQRLRELRFDPARDYLLVAGHMVPVVLITNTVLSMHGAINLLLYSSTERNYISRRICHAEGVSGLVQGDATLPRDSVSEIDCA